MDPPLLQASDADDAALVDLSLTDDTAAATAVPAVPAIQHHVPAISPVQDFFAGTLAGVSLTLVGHPFDTVVSRVTAAAVAATAVYAHMACVCECASASVEEYSNPSSMTIAGAAATF